MVALIACAVLQHASAATYAELDARRVEQLKLVMSDQPQGTGPRCSDRAAWSTAALAARLAALTTAASKLLTQAFPAWSDEAYLEYSSKGLRPAGERMMNARKAWLYPLVLAECVEGKGRFLPAIERALVELDTQPTWTWAAHDGTLRNFRKHDYEVDLLTADTGNDIAQTLYMLGEQLSPAVRQQTMAALEARVFAPMRRSFINGGKDHWWLQADHNWNAVCLKGVIGAALAVLPDRLDRAMFVAAGEHYVRKYIAGFSGDGYSLEGPGYWNYGFSHYTELRELLMQATNGQLDLFTDQADNNKVRNIAMYGFRIEMLPGNVAAFGDAARNTKMDDFTRAYANQALSLGMPQRLADLPIGASAPGNYAPIVVAVMKLFAHPAPVPLAGASTSIGLQSFFDQVGVLVSRPAAGGRMGVSVKASGNANHSHNDVGSYAIGLGAEQPTGDLGMPVYSAKTFSKERYTIKGINSFGHPVPVVAGALQREATRVKPKVLSTHLTDAFDEIVIDMSSAYAVDALKSLTRSLRHERAGASAVQIEDRFEFSSPQSFEVALIAGGEWQDRGDGRVEFWQKNEHLMASIEVSAPYELISEKVNDEGLSFTRIGIRLKEAARDGYVRVRFVAVTQLAAAR